MGWLIGAGWLLLTIGQTFGPARLPDIHAANPVAVSGVLGRALNALHLADHAVQPGPRCRAQADRMGAYAPALVVAAIVAVAFLQSRPQTEALNNDEDGIATLALTCVPVAMGIAILRRRLRDLDVIVNKTVVHAALAAFIGLVYIALVVGIGAVIGQRDKTSLDPCRSLSTAVVAVAFQPVRERGQRLVNRLVYGKRATPYGALSAFSDQLAEATGPRGEGMSRRRGCSGTALSLSAGVQR